MAHSDHSRQMPLDLGHDQAMGREDFIVTPANQIALHFIETWPQWPANAVLLTGPAGSGKTHLATIWSASSGAANLTAAKIDSFVREGIAHDMALLLEDIDRVNLDEKTLFHLLNLAKANRNPLLITARQRPSPSAIELPDLASRLKALPVTAIAEPDDALLAGVITKLFADRQVTIDPQIVAYMTSRMERSLSNAAEMVRKIDTIALERKARITRPLIAEVIGAERS